MKHNIETIHEVIQMAWDDKASFANIKFSTGLSETEVIDIMRKNLKNSSFKLWRKRIRLKSIKQNHNNSNLK